MNRWFPFFISFFIWGCNQSATHTPEKVDTAKQDGTEVMDTPALEVVPPVPSDTLRTEPPRPVAIVKPPRGVYHAVLPCNGCNGIEHTIAFYPDKTYRLEEQKRDKDSILFTKTEGFWSISNGLIWLYKDQVLVGRYRWKGDNLMYLQANKQMVLSKLTPASANEAWRRKKQEGLTFFGVGNEPFWSIEIDEKKSIAFFLAEWPKPVEFQPVSPVASADSISYNATNDSATLHVVIYNTFCSDGMSDYIYNNKVKVAYNNSTYSGCGILFK